MGSGIAGRAVAAGRGRGPPRKPGAGGPGPPGLDEGGRAPCSDLRAQGSAAQAPAELMIPGSAADPPAHMGRAGPASSSPFAAGPAQRGLQRERRLIRNMPPAGRRWFRWQAASLLISPSAWCAARACWPPSRVMVFSSGGEARASPDDKRLPDSVHAGGKALSIVLHQVQHIARSRLYFIARVAQYSAAAGGGGRRPQTVLRQHGHPGGDGASSQPRYRPGARASVGGSRKLNNCP